MPWLCKITLIFNASYQADYRLTFLVDRRVQNYTYVENRTRYVISYQNHTVFFSWEDLLGIPGLQFSHGVTDVAGKPCFWFRLRRDNVPQGTYLELDPTFGYEEKGGSSSDLRDYRRGSTFTCSQDGIAKNITACIYHVGAVGLGVRCAIYHSGNNSLLAETQERTIGGSGWAWYTFNITSPVGGAPVYSDSDYVLVSWGAYHSTTDLAIYYASGFPMQGLYRFAAYRNGEANPWPDPFTLYSTNSHKYSIYCTYETLAPPNIGSFHSSEAYVYSDQWFSLNCTIQDPDGIGELKNCSLELSGDLILAWDNSTGSFTEQADPGNYCTLNSSECVEAEISSTAFNLSWRISLAYIYPQGPVDIVGNNTLVYDTSGYSGTGSKSSLFVFEPKEATEPGAPTGGGPSRPPTPLEKLGVPTPLPYEVAPPEAQWGTIGLIVILTGAVIYYIRRPKSTQQLFKENTAPRRRIRSSPKPKARKVHSRSSSSRRVHSKKQKRRAV